MANFHIFVLVLLVVASCNRVVESHSHSCPNECAPNGVCVNDECQCNPGFAGADCSFPFEQCDDDKTMCFDGARCQRISVKADDGSRSDQYICDCAGMSDASPFQIAECESPESVSCEVGQPSSDYAFCTNGGQCAEMIHNGGRHAGCICTDEFEGRHCQYRKGTAPEIELEVAYEDERSHISAGLLILILLLVFGVAGMVAYKIYLQRQKLYDSQDHTKIETTLQDLEVTKSADEEDNDLALTENDDKTLNVDDGPIVEVVGIAQGEMS
mmetsp:Transcript_100741/g.150974  ORF Transcript_100741/g.150974 Transcript_100741/m.150974 type:complete len:270 (+) Transcript_100741:88-897(+)|eukprot:CAMPEP_0117013378 /NCGR_PEP_ID=MMETSP0472-20121206/11052_1 /TAXON_ID=693140 ORGANISM="Tiarina fusus, Strain LIS" /NCGR_SAMPLE_ID=MMETSP0472 /ASSEMBLY_ACC=CAM_ASM_000603 /LENGTH=269 /DNA_ID=CAMNT_0004716675 /DNA_START=88 /DNA_END=897 /DNA_ORIENTATION=+